ncbi:WXG100 family type VII secretion target [Corynebacterium pacaense]|uniref:WXG100 family type VII secretion target n=1 Tax=Corynebacterium pacaense TaxID=1816684 RepID=UPI0009BB25F5|nr:WXG100 family type VII secretion target [Corynebacterium pacaense]
MSNLFKTESDVMVATAGRVDDTNDQVQGELNRLRGVVDSVRGSWAGQAQVSFDELMSRWNASARELQEALQSISDNIRSNARSFENTETDNAQAFNAVGGGAGAGLAL